jgi:hypothetical protein
MPAIGKQRHRTKKRAGYNLAGHHDSRQGYDKPGPAFVSKMSLAEKNVFVRPMVDGV